MSSEESNKMSKKTPSQDSNSEIMWDIEELKQAIINSAQDNWDETWLENAVKDLNESEINLEDYDIKGQME